MVKDNNGIPIEVNKKPVETVYEMKNEFPTYEEFMKTYEVDERVADSYNSVFESYESISESKGYGPCSDYRCYGSNACLPGESFYTLYTSCPAEGCPGKWNQTYWVHAKDGCGYSNDKISNKFRIRCPDCFNTSHIQYHRFQCPAHLVEKHKDTFWYTSTMSFVKAFALVHGNREIPTQVYLQMIEDLRKPENQWNARSND